LIQFTNAKFSSPHLTLGERSAKQRHLRDEDGCGYKLPGEIQLKILAE
jgi:hypothetical protein